jgi:hypothetical protein
MGVAENAAAIAVVNAGAMPAVASAKPAAAGEKTIADNSTEEGEPVERALARALTVAAEKGDLQAITAITAELRERRQQHAGVVVLGNARRDRGGGR